LFSTILNLENFCESQERLYSTEEERSFYWASNFKKSFNFSSYFSFYYLVFSSKKIVKPPMIHELVPKIRIILQECSKLMKILHLWHNLTRKKLNIVKNGDSYKYLKLNLYRYKTTME